MEEIQQEEKKHNGNDIFHIKEKIYEMILYGNPQLKDFPKAERYVLAGDYKLRIYEFWITARKRAGRSGSIGQAR